jgi:hypothetical protein
VAYTVQTTVDALHNIPIDFKESNLLKQYPKHCAAILLLVAVILNFFLHGFLINGIYNKKKQYQLIAYIYFKFNI